VIWARGLYARLGAGQTTACSRSSGTFRLISLERAGRPDISKVLWPPTRPFHGNQVFAAEHLDWSVQCIHADPPLAPEVLADDDTQLLAEVLRIVEIPGIEVAIPDVLVTESENAVGRRDTRPMLLNAV